MLALLLSLSPAFADDPPPAPSPADTARAKELYENGAELYAEGLYVEAILAWQEGYQLSLLPDFLFNIAGAQERLGKWKDALDTLSRYRAYASTEERETLARRIRNLEERIAAEGPGTPQPQPQPQPQPGPPPSGRKSLEPVVVGGLLGLGGVGLVTGVVSGLSSASAGAEATALCVPSGGSLLCPQAAGDPLRREKGRALLADVAYGLGSAALIGGVTVLAVPGPRSRTAVVVGPAGAVVTWSR